MKHKRLLIINDYGIFGGGTENRIRTLVCKFLETSFFEEVHILQKYHHDSEKELQLPLDVRKRLFIHTTGNKHSFFETLQLMKKYSIDIVQCHNLLALTPFPFLAAKIRNVPVLFYGHDYWPFCGYRSFMNPHSFTDLHLCRTDHSFGKADCLSFKAQIRYFLWHWLLNLSTLGIATGTNMVALYEENKLLQGKWRIVTPWIDPVFVKNQNKEDKKQAASSHTLLFVGSLLPFKGAFIAVQAMKLITKKYPNAQLLLVGSEQEQNSPYRMELERVAQGDGTTKNIQFLGKKTFRELRALHHKATAFVFPTLCMESFGQTWAEAMADGCPVIVSNISTVPEYIENNKTGLLVAPRNPVALAEAVFTLFRDKRYAATLAENGRQYALNSFSLNRMYPKISQLYSEL